MPSLHWPLATLIILLPLAISTICTLVCPMSKDAGDAVKVRPPPVVFSVIWPILFLGLGFALLRAEHKWPIVLLAGLLPIWQLTYAKTCADKKKEAAWLLIVCIAVGLIALAFASAHHDHVSILALAALVAWMIFAQQMSTLELQSIK